MFDKIEIFRMSQTMAQQAGVKHAVIAENIANADTPGYLSKTTPEFADLYQESSSVLKVTRERHLTPEHPSGSAVIIRDETARAEPNGNSVNLETQLRKSAQNQLEHNMALKIYTSALHVLRINIGRG